MSIGCVCISSLAENESLCSARTDIFDFEAEEDYECQISKSHSSLDKFHCAHNWDRIQPGFGTMLYRVCRLYVSSFIFNDVLLV